MTARRPYVSTVLIVEDDPVTLVALTMLLEAVGFEVTAETSVVSALRRLRGGVPDLELLVLDHDLPDGTGAEVAAVAGYLRPGTRIVMHTSRLLDVPPAGVDVVVRKAPGFVALLDAIPLAA